jgi:hypothetical protein
MTTERGTLDAENGARNGLALYASFFRCGRNDREKEKDLE